MNKNVPMDAKRKSIFLLHMANINSLTDPTISRISQTKRTQKNIILPYVLRDLSFSHSRLFSEQVMVYSRSLSSAAISPALTKRNKVSSWRLNHGKKHEYWAILIIMKIRKIDELLKYLPEQWHTQIRSANLLKVH